MLSCLICYDMNENMNLLSSLWGLGGKGSYSYDMDNLLRYDYSDVCAYGCLSSLKCV
jgi:hypothetical protein